jgi:hypothetical protein
MQIEYVLKYMLKQIRDAEIRPEPFPHFVIPEIFPPEFYPELMAAIPKPEQFAAAEYPGTGFGKGKKAQRKSAGLAYPNLHDLPILNEIQVFLRGEEFCRALLEKFSRPDGIPAEKRRYFADGAQEFTSVFDLQIDRRGYEILPHPDTPNKIVTYQFYLVSDATLRDFGTLFCRTRNGRPARRSRLAEAARIVTQGLAGTLGNRPGNFWYWLERTKLGTEIGFNDSANWYPWRMFEIAARVPALPNHFMAFAPNERSYHAVRMDIPESSAGRTVIRGFIRSGANSSNFLQLKTAAAAGGRRMAM